jgi:hypothetical protein
VIGALVAASCTLTSRLLGARKFNVTVAVLLSEFCEFFAWYVKEQGLQAVAAVFVAVKEPSAAIWIVTPVG